MHRDNSTLKGETNSLKHEIINWKSRFEALERSSSQELNDLRMTLENKKKTEIDRHTR